MSDAMCAICRIDWDQNDDPFSFLACGHKYHCYCINTFAEVSNCSLVDVACPLCHKTGIEINDQLQTLLDVPAPPMLDAAIVVGDDDDHGTGGAGAEPNAGTEPNAGASDAGTEPNAGAEDVGAQPHVEAENAGSGDAVAGEDDAHEDDGQVEAEEPDEDVEAEEEDKDEEADEDEQDVQVEVEDDVIEPFGGCKGKINGKNKGKGNSHNTARDAEAIEPKGKGKNNARGKG
jgi:hypothetical protein